jgi:hypothetical protein
VNRAVVEMLRCFFPAAAHACSSQNIDVAPQATVTLGIQQLLYDHNVQSVADNFARKGSVCAHAHDVGGEQVTVAALHARYTLQARCVEHQA